MTKNDLATWRNDVITEMQAIELVLNAIICQFYFKTVVPNFLVNVLYNEQFSFGLRRNIVERIVGHDLQQLRKLGSTRNLSAHCRNSFRNYLRAEVKNIRAGQVVCIARPFCGLAG